MTQTKIPQNHRPKTAKEQINWLRLARSRRVGPATFVRLLNEHASVSDALAALPLVAKNAGVKSYEPYDFKAAERELELGLHSGYQPLFLGSPDYPELLLQAPDAPAFLWAKGNTELALKPCVAMVGARNASSLCRRLARHIAAELGELGYSIVSGLARGIDAEAHRASLETGTIAVQAGGLDIAYPKENTVLMADIGESGLCLSEQPIGLVPQARHFPQRNRIVAGLSMAVIVIEGAARSGSLITARNALDLGREVMAVPGNPMDGRAAGCNMLIRDGAALVRSAADIHEALSRPEPEVMTDLPEPELNLERPSGPIGDQILSLLGSNSVDEDDVIRDSGLPPRTVAEGLTALELQGIITRMPGGKLALAS